MGCLCEQDERIEIVFVQILPFIAAVPPPPTTMPVVLHGPNFVAVVCTVDTVDGNIVKELTDANGNNDKNRNLNWIVVTKMTRKKLQLLLLFLLLPLLVVLLLLILCGMIRFIVKKSDDECIKPWSMVGYG